MGTLVWDESPDDSSPNPNDMYLSAASGIAVEGKQAVYTIGRGWEDRTWVVLLEKPAVDLKAAEVHLGAHNTLEEAKDAAETYESNASVG